MAIKVCYNEDKKHYLYGENSHNIQLLNAKKQKHFNRYIRGIIINNTLYLRVFYPYNDIETLTINKLFQYSRELLEYSISNILKLIKKHNDIEIKDIVYNVDRQYMENIKYYDY